MWARRADCARRARSAAGRTPSGSTWRSNLLRKAARAGAVISRESYWLCRANAPMRARMVESDDTTASNHPRRAALPEVLGSLVACATRRVEKAGDS